MAHAPSDALPALRRYLRTSAELASCGSLLEWDMVTYMPGPGGAHRGRQLELLAGLVHERATAGTLGKLIEEAARAPEAQEEESLAAADVRETRREYDRQRKLPRRLVEELARSTAEGRMAWAAAKRASDFGAFRPFLERILALKREEAVAVGYAGHPYDALLDLYEPGETAAGLSKLFGPLRDRLSDLVRSIVARAPAPPDDVLARPAPVAAQEMFSRKVAAEIGYDFAAGRLDVSPHPFCTTPGPSDSRLTTRWNEASFLDGFFSVLHEAGHGIYEQGLPKEAWGTPCGQAASLGVHESQSRLWENFVGRSLPFWRRYAPLARECFPAAMRGVSVEDLHAAVNVVQPSFIRIEADEATYNLHIFLRFELELAMLSGDLSVADLPGAWNEAFRRMFDLTPPDDARGCLQDVHWSEGLFGYFPTYTLGNLYAAQLFAAARRDVGDLDSRVARGDFAPLLSWLRERIHRHGRRYVARRLVEGATGEALDSTMLLRHLEGRFSELYGI
ncbi:MAG: carboxypeptidase M32 [Planctomycetaceae bacterium]